MEEDCIIQIKTQFKNKVLSAYGVERELYECLQEGRVSEALSLMQDHDLEVDRAIREYNPMTHKVMNRPNKYRKGKRGDYITEKLPRARQRYINEVELFFLLGNGIKWKKDKGDDEAYSMFADFLKETRFDSMIRKAKLIAGAETESAIIYKVVNEEINGEPHYKVIPFVAARSLGYRLRPLFDQYGQMSAFAYGYKLRERGNTVEHWDFLTKDYLFFCKRGAAGWEIEIYPNTAKKITAVYFRQPKAWDGAQVRCDREERLDSKVGDTNNYFADPIASATADVVESLTDPNMPGKLIQLTSKESRFSYVNPPTSSETRRDESFNLHESILFDTFTPDMSFEKMKGLGTLSGAAIRNAMTLANIKRKNNILIYGECVDRLRSVIIAILKDKHPSKREKLDALRISFEFNEPFEDGQGEEWRNISSLYSSGLVSLETAVTMLGLTDKPQEEIDRILLRAQEQQQAQMDLLLMREEAKNAHGDEPTPKDAEK